MTQQCAALTADNTNWGFCPNLPAAYLFAILFGLTLIAHIVQMIWQRKWYCWVVCLSAAMQVATYVLRILSIKSPANEGYYSEWFVLILVAPVFANAFVYMAMGRMVYNFTIKGSVYGIRAWHFGLIFVCLDVLALFVQIGGAAIASSTQTDTKTIMLGLHVYMGGIGFQQLCIFAFLGLSARLHMQLRSQPVSPQRRTAFRLLYVMYAVVGLITLRIIFRLIEYSRGLQSTIPLHEAYQYTLDSLPMLIALVLLNIAHPGTLMPGKECNMPGRKQRKLMKKEGRQAKGRAEEYFLTRESPYRPVSRTNTYMRMAQV
ncbi:hypothetical protein LTR78_004865 [Recurvomyces mirabilis]|uniref:RTA1 domain protein n=1 Tax=Recurvomyces mirabilis TaxID=574656 RepID=A0AAE0WPG3_9PEZI|nr:hypothetical protein LTR78_004865 [Recurvomyces mirabilis]KAK5158036.1 hypothetical protein LTS14_003959 [Recurvomyces mirabilis]